MGASLQNCADISSHQGPQGARSKEARTAAVQAALAARRRNQTEGGGNAPLFGAGSEFSLSSPKLPAASAGSMNGNLTSTTPSRTKTLNVSTAASSMKLEAPEPTPGGMQRATVTLRGGELRDNAQKGSYVGEQVSGMKHGRGKYFYPDGATYEGDWLEDRANGKGIFKTKLSIYDGEWDEDLKHGQAKETFMEEGNKVSLATYVGEYRMGQKHGQGMLTWADGSIYEGQFVRDSQEGRGSFKWKSKHMYSGEWFENHMNGAGRYEWPEGTFYEGEYKMGLKHGEGTFVSKTGQEMICRWEDGRPTDVVNFIGPQYSSPAFRWQSGVMISWATRSEDNSPRGMLSRSNSQASIGGGTGGASSRADSSESPSPLTRSIA